MIRDSGFNRWRHAGRVRLAFSAWLLLSCCLRSAEDSCNTLASDAIEAARQPVLEAVGFERIGRGRELFRQQPQLLRTERTEAIAFFLSCE